MKCFALTGGIASGKSTVSMLLAKAGIPIVNADILAREVVLPNSKGIREIAESFGQEFLNKAGGLDRRKMADLVFLDADARKKLEDITHPLISEKLRLELNKLRSQKVPYAIYEAPLIFEKGLQAVFDASILIITQAAVQKDRLMKRDNISITEAYRRMKTQMQNSEKEKLTRFVIDNSGTLAQTQRQLQRVWLQLTNNTLKI
jgi:dephospho-CoA kinase